MSAAHSRALFALAMVVSLAACARTTAQTESASLAPVRHGTLRFDNEASDRLDVYLVGDSRSWRLGRLEPGQSRWFTVPADIPVSDMSRLQLVVLANAQASLTPMRDPRAIASMRLSVGVLSGQRWGFAQGQLKSLTLGVQHER